jgi:hypothetical protein
MVRSNISELLIGMCHMEHHVYYLQVPELIGDKDLVLISVTSSSR